MRRIYIAAYRGKSLLSRLIEWRTWGDVSHVALADLDRDMIVEAWQPEVRMVRSLSEGHTAGTVVELYAIPSATDAQLETMFDLAATQVGKPYDYRGVLNFMSRRSRDEEPDTVDGYGRIQAWFCSRLVVAYARVAGLQLFAPWVPTWKIDPEMTTMSPLLALMGTTVTV